MGQHVAHEVRRPAGARARPAANLYDAEGRPGGLTGTYRQGDCATGNSWPRARPADRLRRPGGSPRDHRDPQRAPGHEPAASPEARGRATPASSGRAQLESEAAGDYDLLTFANNGVRLWLDGKLLVDTWRQGWLPWWDAARLQLGARERHKLRLEWRRDESEGTLRLKWKTPPRSPYTSLWSEVGDGIDYYFVYGPDLDDVVAGYRELTGRAPLMPRWALGLWQSRERYKTAQETLDTLAEFRRRGIPIDTIVMDWQYWRPDQWGSHEFDPERFPDPAGWIREIHERWNARLMISVWPKFYTTTENFRAMQEKGFLYPETLKRPTTDWLGHVHTFYDAFNPEARKLFWQQMNEALFSKGIDAWWMDATEPELVGEGTPAALKAAMNPTALGSGARMANAYVLASSQAVYEGQRARGPDEARLHPHPLGLRRQPALRRGHLVGRRRRRTGTACASRSRPASTWRSPASPGGRPTSAASPCRASGRGAIPRPEDVEEWRELVDALVPVRDLLPAAARARAVPEPRDVVLRRRRGPPRLRDPARLRPAALPDAALHLLAGGRRHAPGRDADAAAGDGLPRGPGGARHRRPVPVRPLAPRQPGDGARRDAARGLPAAPPSDDAGGSRRRLVRLLDGRPSRREAETIDAPAPYESLPLYVKAGSILPMGPELQHTGEKPADPLTLWVYTGADASFELYEDDGVSYGYEKGPSRRSRSAGTRRAAALTIGARSGSFPGMLAKREIRVVFVSPGAAIPHSPAPDPARPLLYDGRAVVIRPLRRPRH